MLNNKPIKSFFSPQPIHLFFLKNILLPITNLKIKLKIFGNLEMSKISLLKWIQNKKSILHSLTIKHEKPLDTHFRTRLNLYFHFPFCCDLG